MPPTELRYDPIPVEKVREAAERIKGAVVRTPLVRLNVHDAPAEIYLKLENLQPIGSFKLRGAANKMAQIAALAALKDQAYLEAVCGRVEAARRRIGDIARSNGLEPLQSATNFVAIDCGRDAEFATALLGALVARGVFVRMPGVAPLNRCIRVSVGPDEALDIFEAELPRALAAVP